MKLIDVLNMIAKGELEEGTKIKLTRFDIVYEYKNCNLWSNVCATESKVAINIKNLNEEVEIIGKDTNVSTKIEELDVSCTTWSDLYMEQRAEVLFDKLNEVIRELNRRGE